MPFSRVVLTALLLLVFGSALIGAGIDITEDTCRKFADQLINAVNSGDPLACRQLYDTDAFIDRWFEKLEFRFSDRETERQKWKRQFAASNVLFQPLLTAIAEGGSVDVISIHPGRAKDHLVIRVVDVSGAFDYQLLSLTRRADGQVSVTDVSMIGATSPMDSVRTTIARFTPTDGPDGKTIKDAPNADRIIMDKKVLSGMNQKFAQRSFYTVWHFYTHLSPEVQKDKYPLLLAASAVVQMEPQPDKGMTIANRNLIVNSLIKTYRATYPNDPSIEMVALAHYMNISRFDLALAGVDAIDKRVGGDPYLDAIRATIHLRLNDIDMARKKSDVAVFAVPDIAQVHAIAADVAVQQGDFEHAIKLLDTLAEKFDMKLGPEPPDDDAWKKFFESDTYRDWASERQ